MVSACSARVRHQQKNLFAGRARWTARVCHHTTTSRPLSPRHACRCVRLPAARAAGRRAPWRHAGAAAAHSRACARPPQHNFQDPCAPPAIQHSAPCAPGGRTGGGAAWRPGSSRGRNRIRRPPAHRGVFVFVSARAAVRHAMPMEWHGMGMVWHGHSMTLHGMAWHCMSWAWHGLACHARQAAALAAARAHPRPPWWP